MRTVLLWAFIVFAGLLPGEFVMAFPSTVRAAGHGTEVTNPGDMAGGSGAECPHATLCTLRAAIEAANIDADPGVFTISFSAGTFPSAAPVAITVPGAGLPAVTRDDVVVDGAGAGAVIAGASPSLTAVINGLTVTGANFVLRSLRIHGFSGSCIAVTGEGATIGGPAALASNVLGGCKTGVAVSGPNATIHGNLIGFTPEGAADAVEAGIVVAAANARVGGPPAEPEASNRIGFADAAIFVGSGTSSSFSGVRIERNVIGSRPSGDPAPVGSGVVLAQPSSGSTVLGNVFENAQTGILVRADLGLATTDRNLLVGNTFDAISGMAIDLGGDDVRNANDAGDSDLGPNTLLNHPIISRVTQTRLTGTACPGCQVQVYVAAHGPGGSRDYGRFPLSGGAVVADGAGEFVLESPAAAPGVWIVAIPHDSAGNTSEFGPSARVGAGAVLCGNVQLRAGWNHLGYFGSESVALLGSFSADPSGAVSAIYHAVDGTTQWERWLAGTAAGRTLHTVQPGESYWFFATAAVTLPGGFSISSPVPVQLKAGSNDLVYLGASAHVLDALGNLGGAFHDLYRYEASTGSWLRFGDPGVPSWAQGFTTLDACATYQLRLDAPAVLVPLQP